MSRSERIEAEEVLYYDLHDARDDLDRACRMIKLHTDDWVNAQKKIISIEDALERLKE